LSAEIEFVIPVLQRAKQNSERAGYIRLSGHKLNNSVFYAALNVISLTENSLFVESKIINHGSHWAELTKHRFKKLCLSWFSGGAE